MSTFKTGDRVRVISREQTAADVRENAYFPHMAGVEGVVAKVYSKEEVVVQIDRETLPTQNASRHEEIEKHLYTRWMEGLSQDARSNLSEPEKQFHLHYSVLLPAADLELAKTKRAAKPKPEDEARIHSADLDKTEDEFLRARAQ